MIIKLLYNFWILKLFDCRVDREKISNKMTLIIILTYNIDNYFSYFFKILYFYIFKNEKDYHLLIFDILGF